MEVTRRIRVLVADDSPTALRAVSAYLQSEARLEIVGTATDGVRLLREARRLLPELVIVDLSMPRISGLEAIAQLRKSFPELRIIVATELGGFSLRDRCLRCGADGFVYKSELVENLMDEVRRLFSKTF